MNLPRKAGEVTALSMNAHDRRELALIEEALAGGDPQFAARLAAFARLADDGAIPERERMRERRRRGTGRAIRAPGPGRPGTRRPLYWISVAMWVSITLALIATGVILSRQGGTRACAAGQAAVCVRRSAPSVPASPASRPR
jgi:hypothetical protein